MGCTTSRKSSCAEILVDTSTKAPAVEFKEPQTLLEGLCNRECVILVSQQKQNHLMLSVVDMVDLDYNTDTVNIVSYRWDKNAINFKNQFSWEVALEQLKRNREAIIPIPKTPQALDFYEDIVKIINRTGSKYL